MDKRVKVNVGFKLHPKKKEALREYAEANGLKIQEILEGYVDQLIGCTDETLKDARVKKEK